MSLCFALALNHETRSKTSKKNGGTKSPDTVKVPPHKPSPPHKKGFFGSILTAFVGVKLALVALKCDLREDEGTKERLAKYGEKCISYEEGLEMARQIHAVRYLGLNHTSPFRTSVRGN